MPRVHRRARGPHPRCQVQTTGRLSAHPPKHPLPALLLLLLVIVPLHFLLPHPAGAVQLRTTKHPPHCSLQPAVLHPSLLLLLLLLLQGGLIVLLLVLQQHRVVHSSHRVAVPC